MTDAEKRGRVRQFEKLGRQGGLPLIWITPSTSRAFALSAAEATLRPGHEDISPGITPAVVELIRLAM